MPDGYDDDDVAKPNSEVSGVGSGEGFGASLYYLYKAGQIEMPAIAERYWTMTQTTHNQAVYVEGQAPAAGNPAALTNLADLLDDLHIALSSTTTSVRDCGIALSKIALDYAGSDEAARRAFNERIKDVDDDTDFTGSPPTIPDPPKADDPAYVTLPYFPIPIPYIPPPVTPPELDDWDPPEGPSVDLPDDDGGSDSGDSGSTD